MNTISKSESVSMCRSQKEVLWEYIKNILRNLASHYLRSCPRTQLITCTLLLQRRLATEATAGLILPDIRASGSEDHPDRRRNTSLPFGGRGKGCLWFRQYVGAVRFKNKYQKLPLLIESLIPQSSDPSLSRYPMQEPTLNVWGHSFLQSKHAEFILLGCW